MRSDIIKGSIFGFITYGFSTFISKIVPYLWLPIISRYLSIEAFGTFDLLISLITVFSIISIFQLDSSFSRFYYDYEEIDRSFFSTHFWLILIFVSIVSFILFFLRDYYTSIFIHVEFVYLFLLLLITSLTNFLSVVLRYSATHREYLISQFIYAFVFSVVNFYYIYRLGYLDLSAMISIHLFTFGFVLFYQIVILRNLFIFNINSSILRPLFNYALPAVPAVLLGFFANTINRFILAGEGDLNKVGIYVMAFKMAAVVQILAIPFKLMWAPYFWKSFKNKKRFKFKYEINKIFEIVSCVLFLLFVIIISFSDYVIYHTVGNSYKDSAIFIAPLSITLSLNLIFSEFTGLGPSIRKKTFINTILMLMGLVFNILLSLIFIPYYSIIGAVWSLVFSTIILYFVQWYWSMRLFNFGFDWIKFTIIIILLLLYNVFVFYYQLPIINRIILSSLIILFIVWIYKNTLKFYLRDFKR
jgi:O-antigen/teichoic acid export membrane protein